MTKLTLEQQELLFANDCKLINLRYEYHGYTGTEKWAIVTELAEEELWVKYPDVIRRYTPFILLSMAQGEVITEYQNYEARERMRRLLFGHALAINLSFACSLRMGEMLGLTWDCIDISEESLKENNASIFVDKELQRVNRDVMEVLDNKDIIRVFPRTLSNTNTSLVLKTPKTKTSVRKIFLPSTVAQMLLERKKQIDEMKELFGDEYLDYDLVFCHSSGRPMEGQVINRALKKLIQDNDLPDVVFHSFRHASITYKLKWNGGDMKSVQGDSGHARMDMVADVYSHIIDEDRRYNAQKFEEQFYNAKGLKNAEEGKTAPMPKFETSVELLDPMAEVQKGSEVEEEKPAENSADENAALLAKLLSNPDTAALLKALAKTI